MNNERSVAYTGDCCCRWKQQKNRSLLINCNLLYVCSTDVLLCLQIFVVTNTVHIL